MKDYMGAIMHPIQSTPSKQITPRSRAAGCKKNSNGCHNNQSNDKPSKAAIRDVLLVCFCNASSSHRN